MRLELKIDGHYAYPVRAIPFLTAWKLWVENLLLILAHRGGIVEVETPSYYWLGGTRYRLAPPKEWDEVHARMMEHLKRPSETGLGNDGLRARRLASLKIIPPRYFVWCDWLEYVYPLAIKAQPSLRRPRLGDDQLIYEPHVDREMLALIYEGFEDLHPPGFPPRQDAPSTRAAQDTLAVIPSESVHLALSIGPTSQAGADREPASAAPTDAAIPPQPSDPDPLQAERSSSKPASKRDEQKRATKERHGKLCARAEVLRREHPDANKSKIAGLVEQDLKRNPIGVIYSRERIRRVLRGCPRVHSNKVGR